MAVLCGRGCRHCSRKHGLSHARAVSVHDNIVPHSCTGRLLGTAEGSWHPPAPPPPGQYRPQGTDNVDPALRDIVQRTPQHSFVHPPTNPWSNAMPGASTPCNTPRPLLSDTAHNTGKFFVRKNEIPPNLEVDFRYPPPPCNSSGKVPN